MREIYKGGVTPQQKIVSVNQKFGNTGIKNQQGTSRIIYDTLPAGLNTTFRFFEDSASRNFPFTNTGSDGNKLGVGDTMVIESVIFYYYDIVNITGQYVPNSLQGIPNAFSDAFELGILNFEIANNRVLKNLTLSEATGAYSKKLMSSNKLIELETSIVLPPLLPYVLELRIPGIIPPVTEGQTRYIGCAIIGTGGIIAPRTTF